MRKHYEVQETNEKKCYNKEGWKHNEQNHKHLDMEGKMELFYQN